MTLIHEIKIGVLFGRSPAGWQVLTTWAFELRPSGLPFRGRDMSLDTCLLVVSDVETGFCGLRVHGCAL